MKKVLFTLALILVSVLDINAQSAREVSSGVFDGTYVGVNFGLSSKTVQPGGGWFKQTFENLNTNAGIRLGKWITPVWGVAIDADAYFRNAPAPSTGTFVRAANFTALATMNLSNLIGRYKGYPRTFEVIPVAGFGIGKVFRESHSDHPKVKRGYLTTKLGIDFAWNLGKAKAWQFYLEPSINHILNANKHLEFNVNHSFLQVKAGVVYKLPFKGTGLHYFRLHDIDYYDAKVAALQKDVEYQKELLANRKGEVVPGQDRVVKISDTYVVEFAKDSYELTAVARETLSKIKKGVAVDITAGATNEGSSEYNRVLSQNRANIVAEYLRQRGVRIDSVKGLGASETGNRIAIVKIK